MAGVTSGERPLPTVGPVTNAQLRAQSVGVNRGPFRYITASGSTTVKTGAGVLHRIIVDNSGGSTVVVTARDNGAIICTITALKTSMQGFEIGAVFTTSLLINLSVASSVSVVYE